MHIGSCSSRYGQQGNKEKSEALKRGHGHSLWVQRRVVSAAPRLGWACILISELHHSISVASSGSRARMARSSLGQGCLVQSFGITQPTHQKPEAKLLLAQEHANSHQQRRRRCLSPPPPPPEYLPLAAHNAFAAQTGKPSTRSSAWAKNSAVAPVQQNSTATLRSPVKFESLRWVPQSFAHTSQALFDLRARKQLRWLRLESNGIPLTLGPLHDASACISTSHVKC